jgi:hypothetical protein
MASTGIIFNENWSDGLKAEMGREHMHECMCAHPHPLIPLLDIISLLSEYFYILFHKAQWVQAFCQPFTIFGRINVKFLFPEHFVFSYPPPRYSIAVVSCHVHKYWYVICVDIC